MFNCLSYASSRAAARRSVVSPRHAGARQHPRLSENPISTAAAFAKALGLKDDQKQLKLATKEIYGGDDYATQLAETSINIDAKED